ncbi:MAG: MmgE/PrpD family protein, partial [Actinomycetota bacterium]
MTAVETIAEWAASLSLSDVPETVLSLARAQRRSVLGAIAASAHDAAAMRVLSAVEIWAADGPAPLVGSHRRVKVEDALYGAAALSIALDFDDYVCFGHTGHSAVLVPLLLAAETGSPGSEQLLAQVVANEVEARLGGACLIGPLNGQTWSFIHYAGAALAAGRLLGLDGRRLAQALAISLYQPPRATMPGFMSPDSKLLTAAE